MEALMERFDIKRCRDLLGESGESFPDHEILGMRDMLYELGEIVIDAYNELETIDQSLFNPPGDIIDQLNASNDRYTEEGT
jgi:hypothetical protein